MASSPTKVFFILIIIIFLLAIADFIGLTRPVRGRIERITNSISRFLYRSQVQLWVKDESENLSLLSAEMARLSFRVSQLDKENEALRKQLGVKSLDEKKLIMAHPVGRQRYLILDKGEKDGVGKDMTVVSGDVLVGKIVSLTDRTSSVLLTTDPESKIPVWTKDLTYGVVKGTFGRAMVLDEVLQSEILSEGDIVATTGELSYQQNMLVGKVVNIQPEVREIFKKAEIEPLIDVFKLTTVFIVVP